MSILEIPRNKKLFESIMQEYSVATDLASVLVNIHGQEISDYHNFSEFCRLIRSKKEYRHLCQKCDLMGGLEASKNGCLSYYRCHAGLFDFSLPIIIDKQLVGFLLCGQIIVEDNKEQEDYINNICQVQSSWDNNIELQRAYDKIKRVSREKMSAAISLLDKISSHYLIKEISEQTSFSTKAKSLKKTNEEKNLIEIKSKTEIKKALNYIEKNLNKPISLEETANHVYLSHYYFSKLFKKEMNMNFVHYVNNKKVDKAKIFLLESKWPVEVISRSLGFGQTSYFCKIFKKYTDMTPADFRRKHKVASI